MITPTTTIMTIERHTERIAVSLAALNLYSDETREEYYRSLDPEDLPHNIEMLFTELRTVHQMLHEELSALRDHAYQMKQERGKDNVQ